MSLVSSSNFRIKVVGVVFTQNEDNLLKSSYSHLYDGITQVFNVLQTMKQLKVSSDSNPTQILSNLKHQKQILDNLSQNIIKRRTEADICCGETLVALKDNEAQVKANEAEIKGLQIKIQNLKSSVYNLNQTVKSKQKDYNDKDQKLKSYQEDNRNYSNAQAFTQVGFWAAGGLLVIPGVGIPLAIAAGIATAGSLTIQQILKKSEKEMKKLQSDIDDTLSSRNKYENELQIIEKRLDEINQQQTSSQNALANDKKKSNVFRKIFDVLGILQNGIKDWESVVNRILFICDMHLEMPTCSVARIADRDNNEFLKSIREVLEEHQSMFYEFENFQLQLSSAVRSINAPQ